MPITVATVQELIAARDARRLGSDDIARILKLAPRQVLALESGDWAALPGLAFVRGTLRSYGRLVDANVDALLQSVTGLDEPSRIEPVASLHQPMPRASMLGFGSGGAGNRLAWGALALLGLIALAFFFARDGDLSRMPSWLSHADAPVNATEGAPAQEAASTQVAVPVPVPGEPAGGPARAAPAGTRVDDVPIPRPDPLAGNGAAPVPAGTAVAPPGTH